MRTLSFQTALWKLNDLRVMEAAAAAQQSAPLVAVEQIHTVSSKTHMHENPRQYKVFQWVTVLQLLIAQGILHMIANKLSHG